MDRVPEVWMRLSAYERDLLLVVASNEPVGFPTLWAAVRGVNGRESKNYCQFSIDNLRNDGLLRRPDSASGRDGAATYALTDAGRERVEAVQALLWDVATS